MWDPFTKIPKVFLKVSKTVKGCVVWVTVAMGMATPAVTPAGTPDVVVVSSSFDRTGYRTGDLAEVRYVLANHGTADAVKVTRDQGSGSDGTELRVTDGDGTDSGISIRAGGTAVVTLRGTVPEEAADVGRVTAAYGFTAANGDAEKHDNAGYVRAAVPGAFGVLGGTTGEDGGMLVTVAGLYDVGRSESTDTAEDGSFRFTGLPVGEYEVHLTLPPGWRPASGDGTARAEVHASVTRSVAFQLTRA